MATKIKLLLISLTFMLGQLAWAAPFDGSASARIDKEDLEVGDMPTILTLAAVAAEKRDFSYGQDEGSAHFGVGVLHETVLAENFGVETGALYIKRQYRLEAADVKIINEVSRFHIPILFKFWVGDYFSLGAGPYLGFNLGGVETDVVIGDSQASFETSADDDLEFGYDIATAFNLSLQESTSLFLEARYSQLFQEKSSEDYDKLMGLAGVKLAL